MKAYVFPGLGAQFVGMGKDLYDNNPLAKEMFEKANEILGFRITDLMFAGTRGSETNQGYSTSDLLTLCHSRENIR